jgi:uncharacterized protein (DUF1810 family)
MPVTGDQYQLQRFVDAQEGIYADVVEELTQGRKRSHWMWFVFPQLRGLGSSPTAVRFGISSADEARAYLFGSARGWWPESTAGRLRTSSDGPTT